ncbi:hypothetical protein SBA6_740032 [Candidatus Sulfopaludibacter sp. SbA6]|nr:hypothetical protein SBA6_740032 [Candidatus Sulfopaludibacter sp. SbA6]
MITLTVEIVLVVLLGIVLMNLFRKHPSTPAPEPLPDLSNLTPTDARAGDIISVSGAGDDFSDLDFTADRCIFVEAGSHHWSELSGPYRERRVSMRAGTNSDGDLEVAIHADARKLSIEDFGLSEPDLADLDERQNTGDYFEFDNKTWMYRLVSPQQGGASQRHRRASVLLLLGIPRARWPGPARHPQGRRRALCSHRVHRGRPRQRHRLPAQPVVAQALACVAYHEATP